MVALRRSAFACAVLLLAGCGGTHTPDAARGKALFFGQADLGGSNVPTCISCHAVEPGEPADIGTNLSNIGNRAAATVEGQDATTYLRTAIIDPDAFLAGGFQEGIMYRQYQDVLTAQQIDDLIAYMLTLQSGDDR